MTDNICFSYSWAINEQKNIDEESKTTIIRIYCLDKDNKNICLIVDDFLPYAYLQLPTDVTWTESKVSALWYYIVKNYKIRDVKGNPTDYPDAPQAHELVYKKKLYYANLDQNGNRKVYPFLKIYFLHTDHIKRLNYRFSRQIHIDGIGLKQYKLHEWKASPILQLTTVRNIPTAGWIKYKGKPSENKTTLCDREFRVSYKNLEPYQSNLIPNPLLLSFDIEVNSSIPTSMPNADRPNDKVFQLSCVFSRQGSKKYDQYLFTLGKIDRDKCPDITVIECDTEADLLVHFATIIRQKNPNIIMGYNIFSFDTPYMIKRAIDLRVSSNFDQQGFLINEHAPHRTITWSSSAYKNQQFEFLDAEGRIFVDLLPIVKRDYKFSNYQLKTVATHFFKDLAKDPLTAKGIFRCYHLGMTDKVKGPKALALVGKYCVKDSLIVVNLFEVMTCWLALCEMSRVTNVPIFSLFTQGQQLKVFSQVYRKSYKDDIVVEQDAYITKADDYYTGATVFPPVAGIYERVIPFDFSSLYPTTIIAYNICWSTLVLDDAIPDEKCHVMYWDDHIGCVHDPNEIKLKEIVDKIELLKQKQTELRTKRDKKIMDKEYATIEIKKLEQQIKPLREDKKEYKKTYKHKICAKRRYRWLKEPRGVLPEILLDLLDTRSATKKEMKKIKSQISSLKKQLADDGLDPDDDYEVADLQVYYDVLDQRQLALKVSANSAYGLMGTRQGYLPFMPGAMCTTYKGRLSIEKAAQTIQKNYGGVLVYGDTDSNYVNFPNLKTAQECWDYSVKVAEEVSKLFPKPMSLAFEEKIYWRYMILTKKRYMSQTCDASGKIDKNINKKGVLLQRRDNCQFVRTIYGAVVMMMFEQKNKDDIYYYIITELNKLFSHSYDWHDFIITKSVGDMGIFESNDTNYISECLESGSVPHKTTNKDNKLCYKIGDYTVKLLEEDVDKRKGKQKNAVDKYNYYISCFPAQAQLAYRMRERGEIVTAGSRIEYVITEIPDVKANQSDRIESAEYYSRHSRYINIDYFQYVEQLMSPLDQLLKIIYREKEFVEHQYKIRKTYKKVTDEINNLSKFVIINESSHNNI